MEVEVIRGKQRIVRADGEIDLSNVDRFEAALREAARECPHGFVVDLSDAVYLDSAGIQALLAAYRRVSNAGGKLVVVVANPNVREILDITSVAQLPGFLLCDDVPSAEQALSETVEGQT